MKDACVLHGLYFSKATGWGEEIEGFSLSTSFLKDICIVGSARNLEIEPLRNLIGSPNLFAAFLQQYSELSFLMQGEMHSALRERPGLGFFNLKTMELQQEGVRASCCMFQTQNVIFFFLT